MKSGFYCPIRASNIWIWNLERWIDKEFVETTCTLGWYGLDSLVLCSTEVVLCAAYETMCVNRSVLCVTQCATQCTVCETLCEIQCAVCLRPRARSNLSQAAAEAVSVSVRFVCRAQYEVCSSKYAVHSFQCVCCRDWIVMVLAHCILQCTGVCYYTARYNVHSCCTVYYEQCTVDRVHCTV